MPEPSECLSEAADIVGGITDRWAVAGAFAALRYRLADRLTTDADILVEWHEEMGEAMERAGYTIRTMADPGDHPHLIMARRPDGAKVDLIFPTVDYQELALDRAQAEHVLTVEDVIVHKLIAWRPKDQDDVRSILAVGHELDEGYIDHWASEWDVTDRWVAARGAP